MHRRLPGASSCERARIALPPTPRVAAIDTGRVTLKIVKLVVASSSLAAPSLALAGLVPLGAPLGVSLGTILGEPLGFILPVEGGGLLAVAAVSLLVGIAIVRRRARR
jgi:hypothetical protein